MNSAVPGRAGGQINDPAAADRPKKLDNYQSIQYLRGVAALMVVFDHAINPHPWLFNPLRGYEAPGHGVDVFFVISGFIMFSAARLERVAEFARRRFVRIVPLYWIATVATAILLEKSASHLFPGMRTFLIKSLLLIPQYNQHVPGRIWPYLIPGWTLTLEVFFYFVFALGLASRRLLPMASAILVTLVVAGLCSHSPNPLWKTYTSPLLLEFLGGALIGRFQSRIAGRYGALLFLAGFLLMAVEPYSDWLGSLVNGASAIVIVIGGLAIERSGKLPQLPCLHVLGDASYSIYLFQVLALRFIEQIGPRIALSGPIQFVVWIVLALCTCMALRLAIHYVVERPITRALGRAASPKTLDVIAAP